jgi:hypothetical protein
MLARKTAIADAQPAASVNDDANRPSSRAHLSSKRRA